MNDRVDASRAPAVHSLEVQVTPDGLILIEFRYAVRGLAIDPTAAERLAELLLQAVAEARGKPEGRQAD